MAIGRPDIELKWNLVYLAPLIGVLYYGAQYGLVGVAIAFTALYVLTFPVIQHITNKQLCVSIIEFVAALTESFFATAAMLIAGYGARFVLRRISQNNDLFVFALGIMICTVVYVLAIRLINKSLFYEFKSLLANLKGVKPAAATTKPLVN